MKGKGINLARFKRDTNVPIQEEKNNIIQRKTKMLSFLIDEHEYNRLNYELAKNKLTFGEWVNRNFTDYINGAMDITKADKRKGEIKRTVPVFEDVHTQVKSNLKCNGLTFRDLIYFCLNKYIYT